MIFKYCIAFALSCMPLALCADLSKTEQSLEKQGLVDIQSLDKTIKVSLMYARPDNFTGKILYKDLQHAYLHPKAAQALVETYAVKIDPQLHKEVLERYEKLNLAPYKGFINPVYTAVKDAKGKIIDVKVSYTEGYAEQMLRYSKEFNTLPLINN